MNVMNSGEARVAGLPAQNPGRLHLLGLDAPGAATAKRASQKWQQPGVWRFGLVATSAAGAIPAQPRSIDFPDMTFPPIASLWPTPLSTPEPVWLASETPTDTSPTATPTLTSGPTDTWPTATPTLTSGPTDTSPTATPTLTSGPTEATPTPGPTATPTLTGTSPTATPTLTGTSPTATPAPTTGPTDTTPTPPPPQCQNIWARHTGIMHGQMIAPDDQRGEPDTSASPTPVPMPMNGTLPCAVEAASDRDSVTDCNGTSYQNDGLTYTWHTNTGGFLRGTDVNGDAIIASEAKGLTATYVPPTDFIGTVSLYCTIDDAAVIPDGDGGWRDDNAMLRWCKVLVQGDKLELKNYYGRLLQADGKDSAVITIHGDHDDGAAGGMTVTLSTNSGTITPTTVRLDQYGNSNARITAGTAGVVATVTATLNRTVEKLPVVMYLLKVTATPKPIIYDPESSVAARHDPAFSCTVISSPPIAKRVNAQVDIHTLSSGAALHGKSFDTALNGATTNPTWHWSQFFAPEEDVPGTDKAADPGRGLYPYQVKATVTELDTAYLASLGIKPYYAQNYTHSGFEDHRASESLRTTWTQAKIAYNEAAARTELSYTFRVYNVRCPVKPKACRLDIYDPDFNIVHTEPIVEDDFVPTDQASTFQVDKVIPFQPQNAGDYHFVVEAQQSDDLRELNDAGKWALERNGQGTVPSYFVSTTRHVSTNAAGAEEVWDSGSAGAAVKDVLETIGYSAVSPRTPPWWLPDTRGVHKNVHVHTAVGYESGAEGAAGPSTQTMSYNAVWTCIGHGTISRLPDGSIPRAIGRRMKFNSGYVTIPEESYVTTNDWVKQAYTDAEPGNYVAMMNLPNALSGNPPNQTTVLPLRAVRLAAFFGCNTSYLYQNHNDLRLETLSEVAHRQGARSSIGLLGELKVDQINKFAEQFYYYLGEGKTVSEAMFAALRDAGMRGKDTMNVFDMGATIAGDTSTKLDGPKWGREP